MNSLETKIDRLIVLLETQEAAQRNFHLSKELLLNTFLASVVGYFVFRIMDCHFRK